MEEIRTHDYEIVNPTSNHENLRAAIAFWADKGWRLVAIRSDNRNGYADQLIFEKPVDSNPEVSETNYFKYVQCPSCLRIASVPRHCTRPICLHSGTPFAPEVWDGDSVPENNNRKIEESPSKLFRTPSPTTWMEMIPVKVTPM